MADIHRADCEDCPWSHEGDDIIAVTDAMERHQRKERHDVDFERAVATDGGLLPADWSAVDAEPPRSFPTTVTPRDLQEAALDQDTLLAITQEVRSSRELVRTALARLDLLDELPTPDARKGETLLPDGGRRSIGELTGVSPIDVEGRAILGLQGTEDTVGVHVPQDKIEPLLRGVRELAVIYAAGSDDDLVTDGGHETHHCDICETSFDTVQELSTHDCEDTEGDVVEHQTIHVGDHVDDLEDPESSAMVVVGIPGERASEYEVPGGMEPAETVSDYNPDYPGDDWVVEVAYPERTDTTLNTDQTYAFPRSRLEIVASIHDVDEEGDE